MKELSPTTNDEALAVQAGRRGADAEPAFEILVRRYGGRLLGLLRACGVPAARREDVAQEVWLRAWRALPAWQPHHFRGWLFQVARNAAEDDRRKMARQPAPADEQVLALVPAAGVPPDHQATVQDEARKLADCLERLRPAFRVVFVGHAGGERYVDLAERLGVPVGTVQSRLRRARLELQECLQGAAS
jgi:RNA polymerase sigma-70 factor (ECF subfamily)